MARVWNATENASVIAGMPISIAHRLAGGGVCAGPKTMVTQEAVAVVVRSMC